MNDDEMLATMRSSLTGIAESLTDVHLEQPVSTIRARARDRRLRRGLAGLAGVGTAGLALSLGLTFAPGGSVGPSQPKARGSLRTASFTLVSHHNGTATLTINPDELLDATALQNDLQQDGIPAHVTSGSFCHSDPGPRLADLWQVVSGALDPPAGTREEAFTKENPPTITFNPAAMPTGTELSFGVFQPSAATQGMQDAEVNLIYANSYTCTSDPNAPGPAAFLQFDSNLVGQSPGHS